MVYNVLETKTVQRESVFTTQVAFKYAQHMTHTVLRPWFPMRKLRPPKKIQLQKKIHIKQMGKESMM